MNISDRKFEISFILVIFVFHLLMAIQCLNFCDEVVVITSGQQFFSHPESISYFFMYYLGTFFAAVWNLFFADWGIYGFRVFNAIVITITYYIAYRTIKPYVNKWSVVAGVIMAILAETSDVTMVIHHNSVTCLFTTCAAYFLFRGLTKEKGVFFLISGILLGVNVFSRVTNVALAGLIISLLPYYLYSKNVKNTIRFFFYSFLGFIVGMGIVILLMTALGHLKLFTEVIEMLFTASQDPLAAHGLQRLLPRYIKDYASIGGFMLYIYLFLKMSKKLSFFKNGKLALQIVLSIVFTAPLLIVRSYFFTLQFYYSLMTLCFIYTIYHFKNNKDLVYLSTIALLIIYLQPLGGDFGVTNMHSCSIRLAAPLAFGLFGLILKGNVINRFGRIFLYSFIGMVFLLSANKVVFHRAWYDPTVRWEWNTMPKTKNANVLLKPGYAKLVDDVMLNLQKYSDDYNTLFVIGYMPLFNYLSGMPPYLQCCFPDFYSPLMLEKQIEKAEQCHAGKLPIVIRCMADRETVDVYYPSWNDTTDMEPRVKAKYYTYEDFLARHNYQEVWREESFAILLPSEQ